MIEEYHTSGSSLAANNTPPPVDTIPWTASPSSNTWKDTQAITVDGEPVPSTSWAIREPLTASPPAVPSSQPLIQNLSTKDRILVLIRDLYKLAQLKEDGLSQFNDVLMKAHEELHHRLEALDPCIEEVELLDIL